MMERETILILSSLVLTSLMMFEVQSQVMSPVCPDLINLNDTSGNITSPLYPIEHPHNLTCRWQITANKGKRIKLVIGEMFIEMCGTSCKCDYLEIQEGSISGYGDPNGKMCGWLIGSVTYYSFRESLTVLFVSDHSVALDGFKATYTQLNFSASTECSNYTFLNESNRARTYYNRSTPFLCDANISGWYRFSGEAGTQMAESCVNMYHCGTDTPGWLNGAHPTEPDGIVTREVCFSYLGSCCYYSANTRVRNCGGFYIYKLETPPHCYLRYCGNGLPQAPECYQYTFLNESNRARTYYNINTTNLCDSALSTSWYRFGGKAGSQMADSCVSVYHCGTHAPGWLSGTHPAVADGAVQRKVCFSWVSRCCFFSTYISVRNCGRFYVYKFMQQKGCYLRYCGNGFVPSAPADVWGHNTSSTSIFIQWETVPPTDQNGTILNYSVIYKALPDGSPQTKVVSAPTTQVTLAGLNEYTNYSITVFASNVHGNGKSSYPIVVVTDESRPNAPPSNVQGHYTSSTSILVHWSNVPAADQNGVILSYTVTFKALPDSSPQTKVVSAPTTQVTLTGLNEYTIYSITVFASTVKGDGNVSKPIVVITDEDRPNAPPSNVQGHNASATRVLVQWNNVPAADQNGVILSYTVTYKTIPDGSPQTKVVSAPGYEVTLKGLNEYTNYSITVFASTVKGGGRISVPIFVITDEDRPNSPPSYVQGRNTGLTSIFVQWSNVPAADQNGVILSYTVTYKALPDGSPQTKVVSAPTTQVTLTGLKNNGNYSITVFASTEKGAGRKSTPIFVMTGKGCKLLCLIISTLRLSSTCLNLLAKHYPILATDLFLSFFVLLPLLTLLTVRVIKRKE